MAVSRMVEISENQRRADDLLTVQDLMVRGLAVLGLLMMALLALLAL